MDKQQKTTDDGDLLALESIEGVEQSIGEFVCKILESMGIKADTVPGGVYFPEVDTIVGVYLDEVVRLPEAEANNPNERRYRYGITQAGLKVNVMKNIKNMRTLYIGAAVTNENIKAIAQGKNQDWESAVDRAGFQVVEGGAGKPTEH